jgi:hypothetical protein
VRAAVLIALLTLPACSASVSQQAGTESHSAKASESAGSEESSSLGAGPKVTEVAAAPEATDTLPPEGYVGVIDRAGLVLIIDAGLGRFFQKVHVSPQLDSGKFVGFKIASIDPAWSEVPLQAGDVVQSVNGLPIERPEQAMAAFEQLRGADELVLALSREGVDAVLRFRIR